MSREAPPRLPETCEVLVVGGGVNGLGVAWRLAKAGVRDVVVLERKYIPYGASGRNGGGVRAQWGTPDNATLARESIRMFRDLSAELGFNVWFRQSGYLFLAYTDAQLDGLRKAVAFQRTADIPSRMIDAVEASILAPDLNTDGVVGASFSPTDGILFPWAVVFGYWQALKRMGVAVHTYTGVEAMSVRGGRVAEVRTSRGTIRPRWVVNAAGCWSREVAALAGVSLPNTAVRHEIMASEALKPFLDPMVVDLRSGLYMNQDMRGEIIAGVGHKHERPGINFASSFDFAKAIARGILDLFPGLGDVRMMRQWAGAYDVTPDNKPVLGPSPGVENLLQLNGASGHGLMISPMTTQLTAEIILGRAPSMDLAPFRVERFGKGAVDTEPMVIG